MSWCDDAAYEKREQHGSETPKQPLAKPWWNVLAALLWPSNVYHIFCDETNNKLHCYCCCYANVISPCSYYGDRIFSSSTPTRPRDSADGSDSLSSEQIRMENCPRARSHFPRAPDTSSLSRHSHSFQFPFATILSLFTHTRNSLTLSHTHSLSPCIILPNSTGGAVISEC